MARITDTERGARIALATATARMQQADLFDDTTTARDWWRIADAARDQLAECQALRELHA